MYDTLINGVKGIIEEKTNKNGNIFVKGWSFSERFGVCPVRCKYEGTIKSVDISTRTDICEIFKRNNIILCGWTLEVPQNKYCDIQLKFEGEWKTFLSFNTYDVSTNSAQQVEKKEENIIVTPVVENTPNNIDEYIKKAVEEFKKLHPGVELPQPKPQKKYSLDIVENKLSNLYIFDNFYTKPDDIRHILLNTSTDVIQDDYLKSKLENILNTKISSLSKYKAEKNYELTVSTDPIFINTSEHLYSAVIFLTPDAPINSGITLYRSRHTKNMTVSESDKSTVFRNGNQDITEFEPVDVIGNVYNRLVIFNTHLIHGISHNFGTNINNGRLVQHFSFNIEK